MAKVAANPSTITITLKKRTLIIIAFVLAFAGIGAYKLASSSAMGTITLAGCHAAGGSAVGGFCGIPIPGSDMVKRYKIEG